MSERKVFQKYYPPDFDPSKVPRRRRDPNQRKKNLQTVRMMVPMSLQCTVCGEYIYRGKKFNSKKETVAGETYLGLRVFRFYIKCTRCASTLTFKTDPANSTYVAESNCTQNFDARREFDKMREERERQKLDMEGDKIKELEDVTLASKTEMEALDALDEIRTIKAMHHKITPDKLLEHVQQGRREQEEKKNKGAMAEEDEFTPEERERIKRLYGVVDDDDDDNDEQHGDVDVQSEGSSSMGGGQRKRKRKRLDANLTSASMAEFVGDDVESGTVDENETDGSGTVVTFRRLEDVEDAEEERLAQQEKMQNACSKFRSSASSAAANGGAAAAAAANDGNDVPTAGDVAGVNSSSYEQDEQTTGSKTPVINSKRTKAEELTISDPTSLLVSVKRKGKKKKKSSKKSKGTAETAICSLPAMGLTGLAAYGSDSD